MDPFRAEWLKITGHRRVALFLLWIFPLAAAVVSLLFAVVAVFDPRSRHVALGFFGRWNDVALIAWAVLGDPFGRVLLMGYTAFVFAGEYAWGTWKNIVPRQRRAVLILTKLSVLATSVLLAFALLSAILLIGGLLVTKAAGGTVSPAFGRAAWSAFAADWFLGAGLAFAAFLITATLAAVASVYSRSILGGSLIGILLIFAEPIFLILPRWLARMADERVLLHLIRLHPDLPSPEPRSLGPRRGRDPNGRVILCRLPDARPGRWRRGIARHSRWLAHHRRRHAPHPLRTPGPDLASRSTRERTGHPGPCSAVATGADL